MPCLLLHRYGGIPSKPSIVWEKEWQSWPEFFAESTAILQQAKDATAQAACDCKREGALGNGRRLHADNLYERLPGWELEHEHHTLDLVFSSTAENPGRLQLDFVWAKRADEIITVFDNLQQKRAQGIGIPDIICLNAGIFHDKTMSVAEARQVFETGNALRAASHKPGKSSLRLVWLSTTAHDVVDGNDVVRFNAHSELINTLAQSLGWEVVDRREVSMATHRQGLQLGTDRHHFLPIVYEQFNDALLTTLCK